MKLKDDSRWWIIGIGLLAISFIAALIYGFIKFNT